MDLVAGVVIMVACGEGIVHMVEHRGVGEACEEGAAVAEGRVAGGIDRLWEPLKKELQGKDVVFVYLTNESNAIKDWSKNVMEIPGLHYRIPSAKWDQLPLKGGIPQYYLYDRQGKLVWEQTGFGDEVLEDIKRQIASALGE